MELEDEGSAASTGGSEVVEVLRTNNDNDEERVRNWVNNSSTEIKKPSFSGSIPLPTEELATSISNETFSGFPNRSSATVDVEHPLAGNSTTLFSPNNKANDSTDVRSASETFVVADHRVTALNDNALPSGFSNAAIVSANSSVPSMPNLKPLSARPIVTFRDSLESQISNNVVSAEVPTHLVESSSSTAPVVTTPGTTTITVTTPCGTNATSVPSMYSGGTVYYYNPASFPAATSPTAPQQNITVSSHSTSAPEATGTSYFGTQRVFVQDLAKALKFSRKDPLPEWKLARYDGDPLMWHEWYGQFRSAVDMSPLSDDVKLTYLKTLVTGKAKQRRMNGCIHRSKAKSR